MYQGNTRKRSCADEAERQIQNFPSKRPHTTHDTITISSPPLTPHHVRSTSHTPNSTFGDILVYNKLPTLVQSRARKAALVDNLIDLAVEIVEEIWSPFTVNPNVRLVSLKTFIKKLLQGMRVSFSTLQICLLYLVRVQHCIFKRAQTSSRGDAMKDPTICARRMFLAALMTAHKYTQDKKYHIRTWSDVSGLSVQEICVNERLFLELLDYKLFVNDEDFKRWCVLLLITIQKIAGEDMDKANICRSEKGMQVMKEFRREIRGMVV
ncbi:5522_t:CDS:1 [Paraglomus brasilianum]|uniref:5522_t:CDS:1 n=1 Tax=Paraglomus brasilianum TaxID=144538 RepID=A0A9N8YXU2_9GLOM|nr:5522_t:CDS:1 [Paraglomus brasilianum]